MKLPPLTAIIGPGDDGWFIATCPELDIVSQGETPEHAEAMIKEAVELWLECASEEEIARREDASLDGFMFAGRGHRQRFFGFEATTEARTMAPHAGQRK